MAVKVYTRKDYGDDFSGWLKRFCHNSIPVWVVYVKTGRGLSTEVKVKRKLMPMYLEEIDTKEGPALFLFANDHTVDLDMGIKRFNTDRILKFWRAKE